MKIGEAGEAFFVFEAEGDVPDDLVTSPLLEATQPGQSNSDAQQVGRFGAKEDSQITTRPGKSEELPGAAQEPDFLDLNASSQDDTFKSEAPLTQKPAPAEPPSSNAEDNTPSLLKRTAQFGKAVLNAAVKPRSLKKTNLRT